MKCRPGWTADEAPSAPSWPPACPPRRRSPPRSPACQRRRRHRVRGAPRVHPRVRLRGRNICLDWRRLASQPPRLSVPRGASFTTAASSPRARRRQHSPGWGGSLMPVSSLWCLRLQGRRHASINGDQPTKYHRYAIRRYGYRYGDTVIRRFPKNKDTPIRQVYIFLKT